MNCRTSLVLTVSRSINEVSKVLHEYREVNKISRQSFRAWTKERPKVSTIAQLPKFITHTDMLNTLAAERIKMPTSYGTAQTNYPRVSQERSFRNHHEVRSKVQEECNTSSQD